MTVSTADRVEIRVALQSAFGTPADDNFQKIRVTSAEFSPNIESTSSQELRADRQTADLVQTAVSPTGNTAFELSHKFGDKTAAGETFSLLEVALMADSVASSPGSGKSLTDISAGGHASEWTIDGTGINSGLAVDDWVQITACSVAGNVNKIGRVSALDTDQITVDGVRLLEVASGSGTLNKLGEFSNGTTTRWMTIETEFADISRYQLFSDFTIDGMTIETSARSIVTGTFSWRGVTAGAPSASEVGGSAAAAQTGSVYNTIRNATCVYAGVASKITTSLSISIQNQLRDRPVVTNDGTGNHSIALGGLAATGSSKTLFEADDAELAKLYADTETWVAKVFVDNAGNGYVFHFPRVKYSTGGARITGRNQDVPVSLEWEALRQATLDKTVRVWTTG